MIEDGWMHINDYCAKHDERKNSVHARVSSGRWKRGVHYATPTGGECYVHEARALAWLKEKGKLKE